LLNVEVPTADARIVAALDAVSLDTGQLIRNMQTEVRPSPASNEPDAS